jgi:hypothetical protein
MSVPIADPIPTAESAHAPRAGRSLVGRIAAALAVPALFAAITWMCHFTLSGRMGFYEDDYATGVPTMIWSWRRMDHAITTQLKAFPGWQGRAMGWIAMTLIPWVGYRVGGVKGIYFLGFLIVWLNSVLLHRLLRRRFAEPLPILAAIGFIIFPADTTRSYIDHDDVLQLSLMFMLIAGNLYLAGGVWQRIVSYLMAGLCLITYESGILPFVVLPLLDKKPPGQTRKRRLLTWVIHGAALLAIMASLAVARIAQGEDRAVSSSQNVAKLVHDVISGSWIGPKTVLRSYWDRAREGYFALTFGGFNLWSAVAMAVVITLAGGWSLRRLRQPSTDAAEPPENAFIWRDLVPAFVYGIVAVPFAYLLSFTHYPPDVLVGRMTSVHLAAAIGAAILGATWATLIIRLARRSGLLWVGAGLIGLYSALLYSACLSTQRGMVDIWRTQQRFWGQVITLCPDLDRGTTIVCDGTMLQSNYSMLANSWADTQVLDALYAFPFYGIDAPQLYSFMPTGSTRRTQFRQAVQWESDGLLHWRAADLGFPYQEKRPLYPGNTIYLITYDGATLNRMNGTIDVNGRPFQLRDLDPKNDVLYPRRPLYQILLGKPVH